MTVPGEEGAYVRRVAAVVVVTIAAPTDETSFAVVTRTQEVVCDVVREARGDAEPVAPDAVVAGFLDVASALSTALRMPGCVAADERGASAAVVRIGVYAADVLLTGEAVAFGEAVALARALAETARPGTVCISDAVRRALGSEFDEVAGDMGLKPIGPGGSDVHVYLLVPTDAGDRGPRVPRRAVIAGVASAAALGVVTVLVLRSRRRPPGAGGHAGLTLGVMQFRCAGADPGRAWICDAVRDGLNTQLSELQDLKIYSREFVDFLVTRQGLTEIEVANKLGLEKLLTGSVAIVEGTVRVETQIIDVQTGVIEGAYTTTGGQMDVLGLQDRVVRGAIDKLDLPLTPHDVKRLAQRRTTDAEALRRLREAEGEAPSPSPAPPGPSDPSSWLGPGPAFADDADAARVAILDFLERYRRATEARDLDALATMYESFPPEQRAALARYFENVRDLRITIDTVDVAVVGDEAVVSFSRTDDFVDVRTGRPLHVTTRLTKMLRRVDGVWKFGVSR